MQFVSGVDTDEMAAEAANLTLIAAEMERVVPWSALCSLIDLFYPKPDNGRPPVGVERMLRIYFLQEWFNLLDPAVEEALCRYRAWPRAGAGRDDGVPLPSPAGGARSGPAAVRRSVAALGGEGTEAGHRHDRRCDNHHAPSTKNADKKRDPEMHQTKRANLTI